MKDVVGNESRKMSMSEHVNESDWGGGRLNPNSFSTPLSYCSCPVHLTCFYVS